MTYARGLFCFEGKIAFESGSSCSRGVDSVAGCSFEFDHSVCVSSVPKAKFVNFCGCSPLLIPLANYAAPNITRSNRANRVIARGSPASQSATRIRFNAEAIAKCCKQVFAKPTYLERRNSNARTPTEMLPSIPALFAYSNLNASVSSRARAATSAS